MRDLEQSLYEHELITLRVIGEWWDLDLTGLQKTACVRALSETLGKLNLTDEIAYLGPEEAAALRDLIDAGGQIPVAAFERQHGTVRSMGPGRLEREEPWLDPVSPAESLWYRGFLYRAFDESEDSDLVEFYYLPAELSVAEIEQNAAESKHAASEPHHLLPVTDPEQYDPAVYDAVDDIVALLAESQKRPLAEESLITSLPFLLNQDPVRGNLLFRLSIELGLLRTWDDGFRPARQAITWLKQNRQQQVRELIDAWSRSAWNDLCHTPGLICEGSGWQNEPILARNAVLHLLPRSQEWFDVADLVAAIKDSNPDFQRPDGNYDTWYIRDASERGYLSGFENWDFVEGRLIRFLISGPLKWLGVVDTAPTSSRTDLLFRLSKAGLEWLQDQQMDGQEVRVPIVVGDDGTIVVPFNADRYHRFQVARVCQPHSPVADAPFSYQITPESLALAQEQGAGPERLLKFLSEASQRPLPGGLKRAIERLSELGVEARIEKVHILRVREKEILDKLRANPATRAYIGESMSDLSAAILPGDWEALQHAAMRLGLMMDYEDRLSKRI
jgi:hypothetical protein